MIFATESFHSDKF